MPGKAAILLVLILISLGAPACQSVASQTVPDQTGLQQAAQTREPRTGGQGLQQTTHDISPASPDPIVDSIRVLCLYGSIPAKGFEGKEPMYGGYNFINRITKLHGGHACVEYAPDKALSFQPQRHSSITHAGHLTNRSNPKNFNSCFRIYTEYRAWTVLGNYYNNIDSLRRATFVIPVTAVQKQRLDSIARVYVHQTPYDYSFLGMRCASSSYEVLEAAGIVSEYKHDFWYNVFTTRRLRYLLYKEYLRNKDKGWRLYTCKGSLSRQWETDQDNWTHY
ncbi:hypothetical protein [Puia dinghuensis]|uniref:DUF4105 domain-containing protein n=1 Tax=Puia dinghuensis TaxID=1792502 RepID=A0A8J2UIM3_9BACT|nr:hypothetical protein [Puia dinghuensis]GGB23142.1 hypothetical protein GCM10011511_53820 [Puia dinghuensis]